MKYIFLLTLAFIVNTSFASDSTYTEKPVTLTTKTGDIQGSMMLPLNKTSVPVVLIISGSGPTDRDGNNPMMKNNSLRMLAEALANKGIASVRYDKRGIAASTPSGKAESDLRFDFYVQDARDWVGMLKKDKRFSKVFIAGHSEGSLIGMIAAQGADGYISIAGAGFPADEVLRKQLAQLPDAVKDQVFSMMDSLKAGKELKDVDPSLYSLFRPSVQPYMISWFKYNPQTEIKKLTVPILIIQGTTDIQVGVEDAKSLSAAAPKAQLHIIEGMNHIFKKAGDDKQENIKTYNDPKLPIVEELPAAIAGFILGH